MLDKARVHLRQKLANSKREKIPLLQPHHLYGLWTKATRPVVVLGKQLSPAFKIVGDKVVDGYFSVSRVVAEQKEKIEDRLAERKVRIKKVRAKSVSTKI